jgi:hypothetical protein
MNHLLDVNALVALGSSSTNSTATNGHLVQPAKSRGAILATLDGRIPGGMAIPTPK